MLKFRARIRIRFRIKMRCKVCLLKLGSALDFWLRGVPTALRLTAVFGIRKGKKSSLQR